MNVLVYVCIGEYTQTKRNKRKTKGKQKKYESIHTSHTVASMHLPRRSRSGNPFFNAASNEDDTDTPSVFSALFNADDKRGRQRNAFARRNISGGDATPVAARAALLFVRYC
jgi:hypothetical protein